MTAKLTHHLNGTIMVLKTDASNLDDLHYLVDRDYSFHLELTDADFYCYIVHVMNDFDNFYIVNLPHPYFEKTRRMIFNTPEDVVIYFKQQSFL